MMQKRWLKNTIESILDESMYTKEAYVYGLQVILFNCLSVISILLIGQLCFHNVIDAILFLVFFIPLRVFVGGYHCKTPVGCLVTFGCIYYVSMYVIYQYDISMLLYCMPVLCVVYIMIILLDYNIQMHCRCITLCYVMVVLCIWYAMHVHVQLIICNTVMINVMLYALKKFCKR